MEGGGLLQLRGKLVAGCESFHDNPKKLVERHTASNAMRLLRCGYCTSNMVGEAEARR